MTQTLRLYTALIETVNTVSQVMDIMQYAAIDSNVTHEDFTAIYTACKARANVINRTPDTLKRA